MTIRSPLTRGQAPSFAATMARAAALLGALLGAALPAADPGPAGKNLGDLSLEELMDETVTSVSKKAQRLGDAVAAVAVLSNDDLRRSGATSIADALRLVPGLYVGLINASQTAVSVRGFSHVYANKLLVLVDGRAVYTPLFGGVFWDLQQTVMEDVDRIEVIRGPGATLWGANAVNGVINVVTRSARDTLGGLIQAGVGTGPETLGGLRYGGRIDERTFYRVFAGAQAQDDYPLAGGQPAGDNWSSRHGGIRVDHYQDDATQLTWQADATGTDFDNHTAEGYNVNTLARWSRAWSARSAVEAQVYYDRTYRENPRLAAASVNTLDFTLQQSFGLGGRNDVIWGLGYRFINGKAAPTGPEILVRDRSFRQQLYSVFVRDEIKLVPDRLTMALGTKIEHNDYTGFELQPSLSVMFKPRENQTLWASISRAVRTPTILEGRDVFAPLYGSGAPFVGPGGGLYAPILKGNPDVKAETLWAYELGWRLQPNAHVNVDMAVFCNDYHGLMVPSTIPQSFIPGVPFGYAELEWTNDLSGRTYGGEGSVIVSPTNAWRLTAAYSLFIAQFDESSPATNEISNGSPRHQISLRSAYDFSPRLSLDGQFRHMDSVQGVPAYQTVDLRLSYRPTERLEFSLAAKNLLANQHPEQSFAPHLVIAEIPRGFHGKITWRF